MARITMAILATAFFGFCATAQEEPDLPEESPVEIPVEITTDAPVEIPVNTPVKLPADTPVESPAVDPVVDGPADDTVDVDDINLDTLDNKASYIIGFQMGMQLKNLQDYLTKFELAFDMKIVLLAINEVMEGKEPRMSEQEMTNVSQRIQAAPGAKFLVQNKINNPKKVKELPSGLQIEVIREGDGPSPSAADTVECHYEGTLIDGTVFDSSYQRDKPATFLLTGVIPGWTEGLQKMKVGGEYKLYIPYNLAYGEGGSGDIPPFSTLIFKIEILSIHGQ